MLYLSDYQGLKQMIKLRLMRVYEEHSYKLLVTV